MSKTGGIRRIAGLSSSADPSKGQIYTIKAGDTLWDIARTFGIPLSALLKANPHITDPDKIHPGQTLVIPVSPPSVQSTPSRPILQPGVQYETAPEPSLFDRMINTLSGRIHEFKSFVVGEVECISDRVSLGMDKFKAMMDDRPSSTGSDISLKTHPDMEKVKQWLDQEIPNLRDETHLNRLTDRLFYERHPELAGKPLNKQTAPEQKRLDELKKEWLDIRSNIVRPAVTQVLLEKYGISKDDIKLWLKQVPQLVQNEQSYDTDRLACTLLAKKLGYATWQDFKMATKTYAGLRDIWQVTHDLIKPQVMKTLKKDMDQLGLKAMVRGIEKTGPGFLQKVVQVAGNLGINPDYLMAAMSFETGGAFSPRIQNNITGATGLIQFLPATARALGTTVQELAGMTPEQQLDYVEKYFESKTVKPHLEKIKYAGKEIRLDDVYLAILYPAAIGKDRNAILFAGGTREYRANRGLDADHDSNITVGEAMSKVRQIYEEGLKRARHF